MCQQQMCPSNAKISNIPKLLHVHLERMYANIQATYEGAPISDVARIPVYR